MQALDTSSKFNPYLSTSQYDASRSTFAEAFSPEHIRKRNRIAVLQLLFTHNTLSRANISKILGLSKSSTSDVVNSLIEDNLIEECSEKIINGRGKPAISLRIIPNARQIITINVSRAEELIGGISNLYSDIDENTLEIVHYKGELRAEVIIDLIKKLEAKLTAPLLGIGISCPGAISDTGKIIQATNLGLENYNLAQEIMPHISCPLRIINNANTAALGESYLSNNYENLLYIFINRGVGAGMIINNQIVNGSHFTAGEIAHVIVDENGSMCSCGKRGCLETIVSSPAILRRIKADPTQRERIVTNSGSLLGKVLALPVAVSGIDTVVIDGNPETIDDTFIAAVDFEINSRVDAIFTPRITIRRPHTKQRISLIGLSVAVIRDVLE